MSSAVNAIGASRIGEAALGKVGIRVDQRASFEDSLIQAHERTKQQEPVGEGDPKPRRMSWEDRVKAQKKVEEDPERFERAQKGAEQLVAATFIVPILQQLRESNNAAEPFGPGMYEKQMGPMIDAQIADRIVSAQNLPIVNALRDRMLGLTANRMPSESTSDETEKQGAA